MKVNNQSKLRNRRPIWEQIATLKHSTERLIEYKGKHKDQWELMPGELKECFKTLDEYLETMMANYKNWLLEFGVHRPEMAKEFLPKEIEDQIELN